MKSFRTTMELPELEMIQRSNPIATLGSCFSDVLGLRLKTYKWATEVNPFGVHYHPLAICSLLSLANSGERLPDDLFLESDGAFYHYYLPRTIFAESREALEDAFQSRSAQLKKTLLDPEGVAFLTFGTSFIYEREGRWVSNCHQQSSKLFQKRLLTVDEMLASFSAMLDRLPSTLRFVLTLSPVRHIKDTLPLNSLSKSLLRVFLHEALQRWPDRCSYFPAYEILVDDLRDYRFYADDMIHPSEAAVDYIWDLFVKNYLTSEARRFVAEWTTIRSRLLHRHQRPSSAAAQSFAAKLLRDLDSFPGIDVREEKALLQAHLRESGPV